MSIKSALDHATRKGLLGSPQPASTEEPRRPDLGAVGFIVAWDRAHRQLSVEALASLANVSVSTIERIERCENVSDEVLRNVAAALGREPGAFVNERIPLSPEAALIALAKDGEWLAGKVQVPVEPLRKQRQLREISDAVTVICDGSRLQVGLESEVAALDEWLELLSFVRAEQAGLISGGGKIELRRLYGNVLQSVHDIERKGYAVALAGTYKAVAAANALFAGETVSVGVISFFPKLTDPCASRRPFVFAPGEISVTWPDLDD